MSITNLRYLKRNNIRHTQDIIKNYYHDLIHSYGIDMIYFRKDNRFFNVDPTIDIHTYGEDVDAEYYLSGEMVAYMEMMGDSFLLDKFGIQTDGDCAIFFTIEDFKQQFINDLGEVTSANMFSTISGESSGFLSGIVYNNLIEFGITTGQLIDNMYSGNVISNYMSINDDIKNIDYYNYRVETSGILTGEIIQDDNIYIGTTLGNIFYKIESDNIYNLIRPQVGDFFKIDFDEENPEEYEITRVYDRDLQTDGLNPLLKKYIYRCDCVRRDPSEEVFRGSEEELQEPNTVDFSVQNEWSEEISNDIFDYVNETVDGQDNADSVYGNY